MAGAALALSCGEKFTGVDPNASAGTAGASSSAGKSSAGSGVGAADSAGADSGGADGHGGSDTSAGRGGRGGTDPSGGVTASAGNGNGGSGGVVIEVPPIPLAGLELWLRADQGVTLEGDAVSIWRDSSPEHRDATQTASNYRPLLVKDAFSGKPALVFDGENDFLRVPALDVDFSQGLSIFIALDVAKAAALCEGYFEASNASEKDDVHFGDWNNALLYEIEESTVHDENYPLEVGVPRVLVAVQNANGDTQVRGNSNGLGDANVLLPPTAARQNVYIGKSDYADCTTLMGSVAEVLLYSRGVSDPELLQIEKYLQQKYGCCDK
jgi:hypothetical protein